MTNEKETTLQIIDRKKKKNNKKRQGKEQLRNGSN